jgi:hypothetical protein
LRHFTVKEPAMHRALLSNSFLERFDRLLRRVRRVRLGIAACLAVLALAAGTALLAWADYRWELPLVVRGTWLGLWAAVTLMGLALAAARTCRGWGRPRTAAELEAQHPQLGQRVRTAVEFGRQEAESIAAAGTAPSLVAALEEETDDRTAALTLETIVPYGRLAAAAVCALAAVAALAIAWVSSETLRLALRRAWLADRPYTTIVAEPGDTDVAAGAAVELRFALTGRADRELVMLSRPAGAPEAAWAEELLALPHELGALESAALVKRLPRVNEPLEYRALARRPGGRVVAETPTYRIHVRYPLEIEDLQVTVAPPEYTGLPPKTSHGGQVTALVGSRAEFRITLDGNPAQASIELSAPGASGEATTLAAVIDGRTVTFSVLLERDLRWSLSARSTDGTPLPANSFRVRVREDQPPQLSFAEPNDALEVHALAEVLLQVRASDDYGLSRAGIVFQTDSAEEHVLLDEDFLPAAEGAGPAAPQTRALLERLLPLEHFALTQKDCVAYYAFVEDNFPGTPRRTESELRFIDIRPFKISYRIPEGMEGMGQDGPRILSLEEIIRRQRYALNRSIRLEKFPDRWGDGELNSIDRLMEYQTDLAQATRDLADFFEGRGTEGADVLFQAEAAMLAAVDSLSVGGYDTAVVQEKDAQQRLVEARDKLVQSLNQNPGLAQALRQIDRRLAQKLRRPRNEDEEMAQRRLVDRLAQLARDQAAVGTALAQGSEGAGAASDEQPPQDTVGDQPPAESNGATTAEGESADPGAEAAAEDAAAAGEDAEGSEGNPPTQEPAAGDGAGEEAPAEDPFPGAAGADNLAAVEERQIDIVLETQDLQRLLNESDDASDLAKERMQAATAKADEAAGALSRGDRAAAEQAADAAAEMFAELSRQVAALLAEETTQQLAMARDIAADLTFRGRGLADELEDSDPADDAPTDASADSAESSDESSSGSADEPAEEEPPQREAARLAAGGETLEDVLRAIAGRDSSQSAEAVDRVAEMLEDGDVQPTVELLAGLPQSLAAEPPPRVAADVRDAADRLETTARELDRLYRMLVAPKIEELKELEERMLAAQAEMMQLATRGETAEWERELGGLLEELQEEAVGGEARRELQEMLAEDGGGGTATGSRWTVGNDGFFAVPSGISQRVRQLTEDVQRHIQELLLAEMTAAGEEAVPPEYERLADRYREVLAGEGAQP